MPHHLARLHGTGEEVLRERPLLSTPRQVSDEACLLEEEDGDDEDEDGLAPRGEGDRVESCSRASAITKKMKTAGLGIHR